MGLGLSQLADSKVYLREVLGVQVSVQHQTGLIGRSGIGNGRVNSENQRKGCKLTPPASDSVASGGRS